MENLENIKIIFVDIDGTLTNSKNEITDYTKRVFKKAREKGIYIIVCSGRFTSYAKEKSLLANASGIVIADNGALIYDYLGHHVIYKNDINKELIDEFYRYSVENDFEFVANYLEGRYSNEKACGGVLECTKPIRSNKEIIKSCTQFEVVTDHYQKAVSFKEKVKEKKTIYINNMSSNFVSSNPKMEDIYWFDVTSINASKGRAIKVLLEYLKLKKDNAICFGDHLNDYPMFEECGVKVAMKNGSDQIKSRADYIADINDYDRVAKFIENYILKD